MVPGGALPGQQGPGLLGQPGSLVEKGKRCILLALVLRGAGAVGNEVVRGPEAAGIDAARAGSGMASGCGQ